MSIDKEFCTYNQALRLKALGFDSLKKEPCLAYYNESNSNHDLETKDWWCLPQNDFQYALSAPTFSQAFRWFREKHDYAGFIQLVDPEYGGDYGYVIYYNLNYLAVDHWNKGFKTYEEAELACLEKLCEIVESKSE